MSRSVIAAAVVGLVVLAGCDGTPEPSPPPTSEPALTTATATPDDVEQTSEAAPSTEAPEETDAGGAPEMPEETKEQTEAGAEAFALHYIDLINYTGMHPEMGLLEPLGADECASCANYEENVANLVASGGSNDRSAAKVNSSSVVMSGDAYLVLVDIEQAAYKVVDEDDEVLIEYERVPGAQLKFEITAAEPWLIQEIQVATD